MPCLTVRLAGYSLFAISRGYFCIARIRTLTIYIDLSFFARLPGPLDPPTPRVDFYSVISRADSRATIKYEICAKRRAAMVIIVPSRVSSIHRECLATLDSMSARRTSCGRRVLHHERESAFSRTQKSIERNPKTFLSLGGFSLFFFINLREKSGRYKFLFFPSFIFLFPSRPRTRCQTDFPRSYLPTVIMRARARAVFLLKPRTRNILWTFR